MEYIILIIVLLLSFPLFIGFIIYLFGCSLITHYFEEKERFYKNITKR